LSGATKKRRLYSFRIYSLVLQDKHVHDQSNRAISMGPWKKRWLLLRSTRYPLSPVVRISYLFYFSLSLQDEPVDRCKHWGDLESDISDFYFILVFVFLSPQDKPVDRPKHWGDLESNIPIFYFYFYFYFSLSPQDEPVDRSKHWGDLESDEEEEEASEEEEEEEGMDEEQMQAGMASVDTVSTTPAGLETPDLINLRKGQPEKPLYQVLEQREGRVEEGQLMGSSHTYAVPGAKKVRRVWIF
jgi:hypothetical protein